MTYRDSSRNRGSYSIDQRNEKNRSRRRRIEAIRRRNRARIIAFSFVILLFVGGLGIGISKLLFPAKQPEVASTQKPIGGDVKIVSDEKAEQKAEAQAPKTTDTTDNTQVLNADKQKLQALAAQTEDTKEGFTDKLQKFYQAHVQTEVYRSTNDKADVLTEIPMGDYVETYGAEGEWIKVRYNNQVGFVQKVDMTPMDEENVFKVIDGILIVNRNFSVPADFDPGVNPDAMNSYELMKEEMRRDGLDIKIISDYRTYDYQIQVYDSSVEGYGKEAADEMTALPGHSEHQTGYAFDLFTNDDTTTINDSFDDTAEAEWLANNSYKYGFILRYPRGKEDKTGYKYESWHFRYVGPELAKKIYESGLSVEEYYGL
ncbi:MAG: M15 family metallopeptidase [Tissierellia bacterium]|nr:M15 family metallopeptidase [Tissierellia bacterium]